MSNYFDQHLDLAISESLDEGPIDYVKDIVGNIKQRKQEKAAQKLKQEEAAEISLVNRKNWVGLYSLPGTLKTDKAKHLLKRKILKYEKTKKVDRNEPVPDWADKPYRPSIWDDERGYAK